MSTHSMKYLTPAALFAGVMFTSAAGAMSIPYANNLNAGKGLHDSAPQAKSVTVATEKARQKKGDKSESASRGNPTPRNWAELFSKNYAPSHAHKTPKVRKQKPFGTFPPAPAGSGNGNSSNGNSGNGGGSSIIGNSGGSSGISIIATHPTIPLTMQHTDFDYQAVIADTSPVPVLATVWLFVSGLAGLGAAVGKARRR